MRKHSYRIKSLYNKVKRWCAAEGLIYDMFDEEEMVVEPEEIPYDEMERWVIGIDYGTANATVYLMAGKTYDGVIYIAREYYFAGREEAQAQGDFEAQKTDIEYAGDLKQFIMEAYPLTGKTYRSSVNDSVNVIVDPAAASFILQLRRQRFKVSKANNSVLDGIRTVASAFSEGNLKVSSECVNLIDELHTYSWDKKAQERGIDKPVKYHDHCCVTGETLIHTTNGYKEIRELVGTEGYVNTLNPNTGEKCVKKYKNVICTDESARVLKLEFENGASFKVTANHPILTTNGWKLAGELTLDDDVVTISNTLKLKSVISSGIEPVYNMEVEDVHCYPVTESDIIVHNCDALRYLCMKLKAKTKLDNVTKKVGW